MKNNWKEFERDSKTQGRVFRLGKTGVCLQSEKEELIKKKRFKIQKKKRDGLKSKDRQEETNSVWCQIIYQYLHSSLCSFFLILFKPLTCCVSKYCFSFFRFLHLLSNYLLSTHSTGTVDTQAGATDETLRLTKQKSLVRFPTVRKYWRQNNN